MPDINLLSIATRVLTGACGLACLGDSKHVDTGLTWTSMKVGYNAQLRPTTWAGDITSATTTGQTVDVTNYPTPTDIVGLQASFGGTAILDGSGDAVIGEADRWPCLYANGRFPAGVGWGGTIHKWNFTAARRALFQGGDWMTGATTCRAVYNRGSVGISKISGYSLRGGASFQGFDNTALALGYNSIDIPIAAGAGTALCEMTAAGPGGNDIDETDLNLYMMGMRHKVDGATGLTMGCFGIGGAGVADLNSTSLMTAGAISAVVNAWDIDTVFIDIGTNDTTWGATQYTHLLGIIDRWRTPIVAAGRSFKCLLISPYPQLVRAYPDVAAYMAQACSTSSEISFFDLAARVGTYAQILAAGYLAADEVHPSATGAPYFASLLQTALAESFCGRHAAPAFIRKAIAAGKTYIRAGR